MVSKCGIASVRTVSMASAMICSASLGRVRIAQLLSHGAKRTQHLRAVEPLPVTMVTEAHDFLTV